MTKHKLSQYYYLCREIAQAERELANLKRAAVPLDIADVIAEQESSIRLTKQAAEREKLKILAYISNIDDSLTRMIIKCRYIDCLSWQATAYRVGGSNTADSVKKIAYRHIKKDG